MDIDDITLMDQMYKFRENLTEEQQKAFDELFYEIYDRLCGDQWHS